MCFQESRHHLYPAMFARLYLMKAVQQVSSMHFLTHYADPYFVKMLIVLLVGVTCTISNVLHGREGKGTDNRAKLLTLKKKNAAAGYQGRVKIELFKGAGRLFWFLFK